MSLSQSSATDASDLLDENVLSLESSNPADSALLALSQGEQDVAVEGKDKLIEASQPACSAYNELFRGYCPLVAEIRSFLEAREATDRSPVDWTSVSWLAITAQFQRVFCFCRTSTLRWRGPGRNHIQLMFISFTTRITRMSRDCRAQICIDVSH